MCLDWSTRVVDPDPSFGKFHKFPILPPTDIGNSDTECVICDVFLHPHSRISGSVWSQSLEKLIKEGKSSGTSYFVMKPGNC